MTYAQHKGAVDFDDTLDVSHVVYIGRKTTRNINPLHLHGERNTLNKTRQACHRYFENKCRQRCISLALGAASTSLSQFVLGLRTDNTACATLHFEKRCKVHWSTWKNDYEAMVAEGGDGSAAAAIFQSEHEHVEPSSAFLEGESSSQGRV
jgi:hypothetical protein